ncbi:MAG: TetR/AcrR family transcriptional regulator [Caldisericia bacterium]|nr:TetR/AcrR family transcriptional regulator [Caldisericia bacterium]
MAEGNRKEQKERTRKLIVETAMAEFSTKGFAATNTRDIAATAGISHGSVFVHFPTRENLIMAVVSEFGQRVQRQMGQLVDNQDTIRSVLVSHLSIIGQHELFYTRLVTEGTLLPDCARSELARIQTIISSRLLQAVHSQSEEGSVKDLPFPMLFNSWLALINHYLANKDWFCPGKPVIETLGNQLIDYFLKTIQK